MLLGEAMKANQNSLFQALHSHPNKLQEALETMLEQDLRENVLPELHDKYAALFRQRAQWLVAAAEKWPGEIVAAAEDAAARVFDLLSAGDLINENEQRRIEVLVGNRGHSNAPAMIADFVRKIGRKRATAAVVAQQLKILGVLDPPSLSDAEELVVSVFIDVLTSIDIFDRGRKERAAKENAPAEKRRPVPIDETTMELVDSPMATWGGKG
jgi:hypothetical protein